LRVRDTRTPIEANRSSWLDLVSSAIYRYWPIAHIESLIHGNFRDIGPARTAKADELTSLWLRGECCQIAQMDAAMQQISHAPALVESSEPFRGYPADRRAEKNTCAYVSDVNI
jgi:hypothetical protein